MKYFNCPDFIIVGAQKCGTTSLYNYLIRHPDIFPAKTKEIHYFDFNFSKGKRWYRRNFIPLWKKIIFLIIGRKVITGEASPYYMFHPYAIKRIYEYDKNIKIIVLLRDPVFRAWSSYNHQKRKGREGLEFEAALCEENKRIGGEFLKIIKNENYNSSIYQRYSYLKRGEYAWQIENIFKYFNKKNVLILQSEKLFTDTQETVNGVFNFLNLKKIEIECEIFNAGNNKEGMKNSASIFLKNYYKKMNEKLFDLIGEKFNWQ